MGTHDHGQTNFAAATDYRPFAARFKRSANAIKPNPRPGPTPIPPERCIQVGLIGRTYRLTVAEAGEVVKSLREQLASGADRVRVLIPGDKYVSETGSSGNRRAATRDEAVRLVGELEAAVGEAGTQMSGWSDRDAVFAPKQTGGIRTRYAGGKR